MGFLYPSRVLFPILRLKRIKILESYDNFTPMNIFVKIQDRGRYQKSGDRGPAVALMSYGRQAGVRGKERGNKLKAEC
jgi:hypothetical protein